MPFLPFDDSGKVSSQEFVSFDEDKRQQLDLDDENIRNQNESRVFDGSTYEPGGMDENKELYESQGEPLRVFGQETPFRYQRSTNDDGQTESQFVPMPTTDGGSLGDSIARTTVGMGLNAGKATAGFAEYALDSMQEGNRTGEVGSPIPNPGDAVAPFLRWAADTADNLLGTEFSDTEKNWVDENFLTIPPQNDLEAIGMEIGSMMIGGVGGAKIAQRLVSTHGNEYRPVVNTLLKVGEWFKKKATDSGDVANSGQKLAILLKGAAVELGATVGATITTPSDVDSISAEGIGDGNFGQVLPEEIEGMNANERNRTGHLLDNSVLGAAGMGIAKLFSMGGKAVGGMLGMKGGTSEAARRGDALLEFTKGIDPGIAEASEEEMIRRVSSMSDAVKRHSVFSSEALGTEWTRSTTNAVARASEDYVDEAYGYLRNQMSPQEWDAFRKNRVGLVENNISQLRRDLADQTIVQASDAITMQGANEVLGRQADELVEGDPTRITQAGEVIGSQALMPILRSAQDASRAGDDVAAASAERATRQGAVNKEIDAVRDQNNPFNSEANLNGSITNLGNRLQANAGKSLQATDEAFKAIPEEVTYDKEALADAVISASGVGNALTDLGVRAPGAPVRDIPDEEAREQLIKSFPNSLKELYNKHRRALAGMMDAMDRAPVAGQTKEPLVMLKNFIDDAAENSGDPKFSEAMQTYRDEQDFWGLYTDMSNFRGQTADVISSRGKFYGDAQEEARRLVVQGLNDPSGARTKNVFDILDRYGDQDVGAEFADSLMSTIATDIYNRAKGGDLSFDDITSGMTKERVDMLERLNPTLAEKWRDLSLDLQSAENGLKSAEDLAAEAQRLATETRQSMLQSVAADFLAKNNDGSFRLAEEGGVTQAFNNIFRSEEKVTNLLETIPEGDALTREAMQSQYLRWLTGPGNGSITTSRAISGTGRDAVNEGSLSNLTKILNGSDKTGMSVLRKVFSDKPEFSAGLADLLEEMQFDIQARQLRPNTFSSNTAIDYTRKQFFNSMITMAFGTLSRPGAMFRNVVNNLTGKQRDEYNKEAAEFIANILANSKYFTENLDGLVDGSTADFGTNARKVLNDIYGEGKWPASKASVRAIFQDTTPDNDLGGQMDDLMQERDNEDVE